MLSRLIHWLARAARVFFQPPPSFRELAGQVLEEKKLRAPATYESARNRLGRLGRFFSATSLAAIDESAWQRYVAHRRAELPGCKLFDDRKYMTQVLLLAYRRGLVKRRIQLWIPDLAGSAGREITGTELRCLLRAASPELRFQIEIAFRMGLRLREMLFLRWDRIDWQRRTLRLAPTDTKTRRGREVPINADLFARFRRRFLARRSPFVFPARFAPDKPQHDNKTAWQRCRRLAGVSARWHDLRHTCATVMLRRGASLSATRRILGMSERVLLEIYQHLNVSDLHRANAVMSDRARPRPRARA